MVGAVNQAGDADSSRAPGLTSGSEGHRGSLHFTLWTKKDNHGGWPFQTALVKEG